MWAILDVFSFTICGYTNNLKYCCIQNVYLFPTWAYKLYETPLHEIYHVMNSLRLFPCYRYGQWRYPFLWVCSMDYGYCPVVYTYYISHVRGDCLCHMCSHTNDLNHCCIQYIMYWIQRSHFHATTSPHLPHQFLLGTMLHGLCYPPRCICMQVMSNVIALELCSHINDLKHRCMQHVM